MLHSEGGLFRVLVSQHTYNLICSPKCYILILSDQITLVHVTVLLKGLFIAFFQQMFSYWNIFCAKNLMLGVNVMISNISREHWILLSLIKVDS